MEKLKAALRFGGILSEPLIDKCVEAFEERRYSAQEHFLGLGEIANEVAFVQEGIFRCYAFGKQGEEVTKYFVSENQFMLNLESYYNRAPTESMWQAVVEGHVYVVGRNGWNRLMEEIPNLFILTKSLTEATLLTKLKDNDFLNFGNAQDKYEQFLTRYPELARRVPQQYIASYLKITPQSLSRIRRSLATRQ